ncbi:hypothetical protein KFU94_01190 [Chloroflexi bacterium TSY]|nr:hypothetical protein [Chloroflexi bacterium TSY]
MIVRFVTYHALPEKDVEIWLREVASEVRGVEGMHHVEFIRSQNDPTQYGAVMHFRTKEDLDEYKSAGLYRRLVQSISDSWLNDSKPVNDQVFEGLDI